MRQEKIINDSVFGTIKLPPLCVKIIDTPEFQRLRYIQQVGCTTFVYPGATHSRFSHSIGVLHVAKIMLEKLKEKQCHVDEKARITDNDILCVAVAALCHDLGHGPFSHTWEHFMTHARPAKRWKHEVTSVLMFRKIWNKLHHSDRHPLEEVDKIFIEELMIGVENPDGPWKCKGRPQAKSYLYEIVANKVNGVDVDRFAYICQDCYYLNIPNNFDFSRLMEFVQIIPVNGRNHICFKSSEILNIYAFFAMRWKLHRQAYQHRVARLTEAMLIDAFVLADESLLTVGTDGMKLRLSETVDDLDAYVKMVDCVYHRILDLPDHHPARILVDRIQTRDLYVEVGSWLLPKCFHISGEDIKARIIDAASGNLDPQDFFVKIVHYDFGMQGKNPVDFVNFYDDVDSIPVIKKRSEISHILPETYEEEVAHVVCKKNDTAFCTDVKLAFQKWVRFQLENTV